MQIKKNDIHHKKHTANKRVRHTSGGSNASPKVHRFF